MRVAHCDPVRLEVFHHLVSAFCEEAGARLMRSAVSPNIRERRDFSVAIFDGDGRLLAQAAHIPVHLGSARGAVEAVRAAYDLRPGDVALLNDPYAGGTHLPDLTVVRPVFLGVRRPRWYLVDRAHHADVGGASPGSMGIAPDLHAEGLVLPPVLLRRRGVLQRDLLRLFARNVRGADERLLDLQAQEACLERLEQRLLAFARAHGLPFVLAATEQLFDYSERAGRAMLRTLRRGRYRAHDRLDDDGFGSGPLRLDLCLRLGGPRAEFDWRGTCGTGGCRCGSRRRRRRRLRGARAGRTRPGAGGVGRHDEQPVVRRSAPRRQPLRQLRDLARWRRRRPARFGPGRDPDPHDEHAQHAGGGVRAPLPGAHRSAVGAARQRRARGAGRRGGAGGTPGGARAAPGAVRLVAATAW